MLVRLPLILTVLVVALGSTLGWQLTQGFRAFTWESQRRLQVEKNPVMLPNAAMENQYSNGLDLLSLHGKVLAVNFIYTRCSGICGYTGAQFARLQSQISKHGYQDRVQLLSISLDPEYDTPEQLRSYLSRFSQQQDAWQAVRVMDRAQSQRLLDAMGVVSIDDGRGGIMHNAATHVVDRGGRLVRVMDERKVDITFQLIEQLLTNGTGDA